MRVDYLGLEAFVRIAEHGSFQRAAEALHLSQTALSHRLRKLEADLGSVLLIRSSREVSLSPAGQELLPNARRLLKELADCYAAMRVRSGSTREQVAFACLPTIAHSRIPPVLARFAERYADAAVRLRDIPVAQIAERVRSGEVEFGVTIVTAHLPDLRSRALFSEPYVLLLPAEHPLAAQDSVARTDLDGQAMVRIATQSKNRQLVDDALGEARDRMQWRLEVQNATTAMRLVAHGLALTILPRSAADVAPPGVVMRPFADIRPTRTIGIVSRRGVPPSKLGAALMLEVDEALGGTVGDPLAEDAAATDAAGAPAGPAFA